MRRALWALAIAAAAATGGCGGHERLAVEVKDAETVPFKFLEGQPPDRGAFRSGKDVVLRVEDRALVVKNLPPQGMMTAECDGPRFFLARGATPIAEIDRGEARVAGRSRALDKAGTYTFEASGAFVGYAETLPDWPKVQ